MPALLRDSKTLPLFWKSFELHSHTVCSFLPIISAAHLAAFILTTDNTFFNGSKGIVQDPSYLLFPAATPSYPKLESKSNEGSICSLSVSRVSLDIYKSTEKSMEPLSEPGSLGSAPLESACSYSTCLLCASLALLRLDSICRFLADVGGITSTTKTAASTIENDTWLNTREIKMRKLPA